MPKLWTETVDAHRHAVRETIMDAAWTLVTQHGLPAVTMSQIAEAAGIGRATLYKYFPDVNAVLVAWHHRQVTAHLDQLAAIRDRAGDPYQRLTAVLRAYADICHHRQHHGAELIALLHHDERAEPPQRQLIALVRALVAEAAETGAVRDDIRPEELAAYCVHALAAAGTLSTRAAVQRLVDLTVTALRPPPAPS